MKNLGTVLRSLSEQLDTAVERVYKEQNIAFKPRYFPVANVLLECGSLSIKHLSEKTNVSHSAVSQTVAAMKRDGWLEARPGNDKREKLICLSELAQRELPNLERIWKATAKAALSLDAELNEALFSALVNANKSLQGKSFYSRIKEGL